MKRFLASKGWNRNLSLKLLCDAALGMMFLHSKDIVHHDLKAENVLIDVSTISPTAKIADFGLAKVRTRIEDSKGVTIGHEYQGVFGATLRYAPPEFFRTGAKMGKPADAWTYGMMCYRVLSRGQDPYDQYISQFDVRAL